MVDPLFYLIALFVCFSYPSGEEPLMFIEAGRWVILASTIGALLTYGLICWILYTVLREKIRISSLRLYLRFLGMPVFAVIIFIFNYIYLVDSMNPPNSVVLRGLLYLLPYLLISGINTWLSLLRDASKSGLIIRDMVEFSGRMFLGLVLLPLLAMLGFVELLEQVKDLEKLTIIYPITGVFFLLALAIIIFVFSPFLVRISFSGKSISSSPIKDRIFALCRKANFKFADIIVIPTKGAMVANAFVTGILPGFRYIFITQHLIDNMTEREVEAVVAHEISHVTRGHMICYLGFMLSFVALSLLVQELSIMALNEDPPILLVIGMFLFVWLVLFGTVSKRFESEADLNGALLIESYEDTISALDKVATLNRISRRAGSLRHFSIETRTLILLSSWHNPVYQATFLGIVSDIKRVLLLSTAAAALYIGLATADQLRTPEKNARRYAGITMLREGKELVNRGQYEPAIRVLTKSLDMDVAGASTFYLLGRAHKALDQKKEALDSFTRALAGGLSDPSERLDAKRSIQEIQRGSIRH